MTFPPRRDLLRIASRNSPLALWQANYVKSALESAHPELEVVIIGFTVEDHFLAAHVVEIILKNALIITACCHLLRWCCC